MNQRSLFGSAMGQKALMAGSGVILIGFVLGHLAGNLKLYQGAEKINAYAGWLREMGAPVVPYTGALWLLRAGVLVAVAVHIVSAYRLTVTSRRARPEAYAGRRNVGTDYASRTMRWGGVIILLFVIYHLLHLTWGSVHPDFHGHRLTADGHVAFDVYHNVVAGFQVWWVSAFYALAQVCVGLHLYHGLWSMMQTLGLSSSESMSWQRRGAAALALLVTLGNLSFPIAVLTGMVS